MNTAHVGREKWGSRDSNPDALRHMILNHARLPVPTLPRSVRLSIVQLCAALSPTPERPVYGL